MRYRSIEIDGQPWKWLVGRTFVEIRDPNDKKSVVEAWAIKGHPSRFAFEQARLDKSPRGVVMPSDVKLYIEQNLLPES